MLPLGVSVLKQHLLVPERICYAAHCAAEDYMLRACLDYAKNFTHAESALKIKCRMMNVRQIFYRMLSIC